MSAGEASAAVRQEDQKMKRKAADLVLTRARVPKDVPDERGQLKYYFDQHSHPRQQRIWFKEEGHTYGVDWDDTGVFSTDTGMSVSSLPKPYFEEFDAAQKAKDQVLKVQNALEEKYRGKSTEEMCQVYAAEHPLCAAPIVAEQVLNAMQRAEKVIVPKYRGKTWEQIRDLWAADGLTARNNGTAFHLEAEKIVNKVMVPRQNVKPGSAYTQLYQFLVDNPLKVFLTEPLLFDETCHVTGSPDILYFSNRSYPNTKPGQPKILYLQIGDYKNSKRVSTYGFNGRRAKGYLSSMQDCNGSKYHLQLNCYKKMLEDNYKHWVVNGTTYDHVVIDRMFLIVCHDRHRDGKYKIMEVRELPELTEYLFEQRRQQWNRQNTSSPAPSSTTTDTTSEAKRQRTSSPEHENSN